VRRHGPEATRSARDSEPWSQAGFTYLFVLLFVAVAGMGLAAVATVWHTGVMREKEAQLLFVGDQFRRAIDSYYALGPKQLPASLDDLVADKRFPHTVRHLRRIYFDPMTGKADWGLVMVGDRIAGVYSSALGEPLKRAGFDARYAQFETAEAYQGWVFRIDIPGAPAARGAAGLGVDGAGAPGPARPDVVAGAAAPPAVPPPRARCDVVYEAEVERCYNPVLSDAQNRTCEATALRTYEACLAQQ
jgi:type II secretory pathway pseudopilin PulG